MSNEIIFSASIIASFVAGMVALFAPCCITVLLPAYLASAFRERRHMIKMTFIFFAGISVIIVPIGLGAAALAQFFRDFHKELYVVGGTIMMLLGVMAFLGKGFAMLPMSARPSLGGDLTSSWSVFILGVLSGAATSCCAPVLAGAVTLAIASGVFWKALVVTFAYVFGMTFPLFIAGYFYDRFKVEESRIIRGKLLSFRIGSRTAYIHSTNILAGIIFLVIGAVMLAMAATGNAFWSPAYQVVIGKLLTAWSAYTLTALGIIPDGIWAVVIIGFFLFLLRKAVQRNKK